MKHLRLGRLGSLPYGCTLLLRTLLCCFVLLASYASAISYTIEQSIYTVQVAALTNQESAENLRQALQEQGFPAYILRAVSPEQTLFRVRVGAFIHRDSAVAFAQAMQGVQDTVPVPVQVANVSASLVPLEAERVARYPYAPEQARLELIPWQQSYLLRFQSQAAGVPLEARYSLLRSNLARRNLNAWWLSDYSLPADVPVRSPADQEPLSAAEEANALWLLRIYSYDLWPSNFADFTSTLLEQEQAARVRNIAADLGLSPDDIRAALFRRPASQGSVPFVVLAARYDINSGYRQFLPTLGDPNSATLSDTGPALRWFDSLAENPPALPRSLDVVQEPFNLIREASGDTVDIGANFPAMPAAQSLELTGRGWRAEPDGIYTRITLQASGQSWRALIGYPLWAHEEHLLVFVDNDIALYTIYSP